MQVIGVIAEYNPFHSGHQYHLQTLRKQIGTDGAIVCCMSGNWVQRADAALCDKWTRSGMALRGGADLILELPTPWAISSAEGFAQGAVSLLAATGVVDTLCFGSEAGSLAPLSLLADFFSSQAYSDLLRPQLDAGLSFPAARQAAAQQALGQDAAAPLQHANNNLGIEYLRALAFLGSDMVPHTLLRQGSAHDGQVPSEGFASASYLRRTLLADPSSPLQPYVSQLDQHALLDAGLFSLHYATRAVLARLRGMRETELLSLPESEHGLAQRLARAAHTSFGLDELYAAIKSRRYTHARIRRLVLRAFLGLPADLPPLPPYLRVLGLNACGQALLRRMKTRASLPILTKPAHIRRLDPAAQQLFAFEAQATGLYTLCRKTLDDGPLLSEYRNGPLIDAHSGT